MPGSLFAAGRRPWIFISYRREDSAGYAGRLHDDLADVFGKGRVFLDTDMIQPGRDFTEAIAEALARCDVLLALIGRTWLTAAGDDGRRRLDVSDDLVRRELEEGIRRDVRLIPLLVDNAAMPNPSQLPATLASLATKQAFPLAHARWQSDMAALVRELRPAHLTRRRLVLGAAAGSLLGLTAVAARLVVGGRAAVKDIGPPDEVRLSFPYGVCLDSTGRIYVADSGHLRVLRVNGSTVDVVAGTGEGGRSGDGGQAIDAHTTCHGLALSAGGDLYIAAIDNNDVRKVDTAGVISTFAGTGDRGHTGDSGPADQAELFGPWDVDVAADGTVYIADTFNNRIRRVDTQNRITTVAGTGEAGFAGDGGPASTAHLNGPRDVAVDPDGMLYIADGSNHRIRRVDPAGRISTIAGTGSSGFGGDGGSALEARLNTPHGVAVARDGAVYIGDLHNNRVRRIDPSGVITTVAGTGEYGFSGDGGPATRARLAYPRAVAVGVDGTIYVADINNHRIRKIDSNGVITTAVGRD